MVTAVPENHMTVMKSRDDIGVGCSMDYKTNKLSSDTTNKEEEEKRPIGPIPI